MNFKKFSWWLAVSVLLLCLGCKTTSNPIEQVQPSGQAETEGNGIIWAYHDLTSALEEAQKTNKPIMMDVFATWCAPCKLLEQNVFSRPEVGAASKSFVTAKVDGDKNEPVMRKYRVTGYPTVLFLSPDGNEINRSVGAVSQDIMLDVMAKAKQKFEGEGSASE